MHWIAALNKAVYGPCNESNGARNRTRTHGPNVNAGFASYGAGCSGLSLAPDNAPWNATTFSATCTGMNAASPIKLSIWGFAATAIPVTGILGAGAGCTLLNTADVIDVAHSRRPRARRRCSRSRRTRRSPASRSTCRLVRST